MQIDQNSANVLISLFAVLNTALLVFQAVRLQSVHHQVDGAKTAAVSAARDAGFAAAFAAKNGVPSAPPPVG
jgi:hypothetical protein